MPKLSFIDSLLGRGKRSIPSDILKAGPVLNIKEGEQIVVTYTSAANKMKIFSAYVREGLENGDAVWYSYPDEEKEIVRAKLVENGIDVKKYEKDDTLHLVSLTESFMPNGKLDYEKAVIDGLEWWAWAKKKGYSHIRDIEDMGDFSFVNDQWQKWVTEYWLDPRWDDPNISEWIAAPIGENVGVVYIPSIMSVTAINVERMTKKQVEELLKALGGTMMWPRRFFIDLLVNMNSFSETIGLAHERLVGQKILLEFDPVSNYEKVVDSLAKESMANVEPTFVFTSSTNPIRKYLANQSSIKFFLMSISTSIPKSVGENKMFLPAKNTPLILDAITKILETYGDDNVCFVFDILSELLPTIGRERSFTFLRHALDILSSEKVISLFLLNTSAHKAEVVSRVRNFFSNQLVYDKNGLKIMKISQF